MPSCRDSCRPTAVLPEPMGPMRNTFVLPSIVVGSIQKESGRPKAAAQPDHPKRRAESASPASVHVDPFANDLRRDEDQQLVFVVGLVRGLEQMPQHRN